MTVINKILSTGIFSMSIMMLVSSCSHSSNDGIPIPDKNKADQAAKSESLTFKFDEAVPVDSTTFVMYPLALGNIAKNEGGLKSYSRASTGPYWNIAFYDIKTGTSNLLDTAKPIRINSFQKLKDLIVYDITLTDYNGDGLLDHQDPSYLFTSTLSGMQFKQITPNNMDVKNFKSHIAQTLLIQTTTDSNGDKKFGDDDDVVPLVFDIQKGGMAKEVFGSEFKAKIAEAFDKVYK